MLDLFEVGVGRHADVDDGARPPLRHVADPGHLTVAHVPQRAVDVAHLGDTHTHVFDHTARETEIHHIADADLVLGHEEHAVEHVLDDVLGAETETSADRSGQEGQRAEQTRIERVHDEHDRDHDQHHVHDVLQDGAERACALHQAHIRERRALECLSVVDRRLVLRAVDDAVHHTSDDEPQDEPDHDAADDDDGDRQGIHADLAEPGEQRLHPVGEGDLRRWFGDSGGKNHHLRS